MTSVEDTAPPVRTELVQQRVRIRFHGETRR